MNLVLERKNEYPEHDKLHAVKDQSQAIGSFLDNAPYTLAEYVCPGEGHHPWVLTAKDDVGHERGTCPAPRLVPVGRRIEDILADYFGIDLNVIEQEKRAMLDRIRAAQGSA